MFRIVLLNLWNYIAGTYNVYGIFIRLFFNNHQNNEARNAFLIATSVDRLIYYKSKVNY